jgi:hypothetical protein
MKLGVSYIVFDGVELLESSIKQIRNHVDFIQVIYQTTSWFGKKIPSADLDDLRKLKHSSLIDELTPFTDFSPLSDTTQRSIVTAKSYERAKRQLGLNTCLRQKCTHYLCMDADEFYTTEEFKNAKHQIIHSNLTATSVKFINYVNIPTLHRGMESRMTVPFICKIDSSSKMVRSFFTPCDPTRGISNTGPKSSFHSFAPSVITMHHMETVRKNLLLKYESTTRSIFNRVRTDELVNNIKTVNEETDRFGFNGIIFPKTPEGKLYKAENIFDIPYDKW